MGVVNGHTLCGTRMEVERQLVGLGSSNMWGLGTELRLSAWWKKPSSTTPSQKPWDFHCWFLKPPPLFLTKLFPLFLFF